MVDFDTSAGYTPEQVEQYVTSPEAQADAKGMLDAIERRYLEERSRQDARVRGVVLSDKVQGLIPPEPPFTVAAHPGGGSVAIIAVHYGGCGKIQKTTPVCTCGADETWANFRAAVNDE